MSVEHFVDTNIFIYDLEARDEQKAVIAERIVHEALQHDNACISFQVVQECLNTMIRKAEIPLTPEQVRRYLDTVLAPLYKVPASLDLYRRALGVQARYQYGFYDALIIAGALQAGCRRLLTEDLHHGQQIEGLVIENPFL